MHTHNTHSTAEYTPSFEEISDRALEIAKETEHRADVLSLIRYPTWCTPPLGLEGRREWVFAMRGRAAASLRDEHRAKAEAEAKAKEATAAASLAADADPGVPGGVPDAGVSGGFLLHDAVEVGGVSPSRYIVPPGLRTAVRLPMMCRCPGAS